MKPNNKKISKFLSLVLRHKPETIGLCLDENGWAETQELLERLAKHNKSIDLKTLEEVVANNDKKRFAFNADRTKIRASQGHSVRVNLGYTAVEPPEMLYHGTATRFLDSIQKQGLLKGNRHQVHLSKDLNTATAVGRRHGKVVVMKVKALEMYQAGFEFFVSENQVWLTDQVPVEYLEF
ncbi:MAG: RNA:NAD 2'-phosphotransferase [uncultured Aureispira sp.]|uniref:Probable RNA 2'-phosphotransferase n=1 Tax=uncultured Aureispira sp. TaxID=1331704 RepID=A0A6S6TXB9_9BACT|nr:MAG: RNA:NAD 2'-phosphotransferase [uncultured Aureispira sp.]